MRTVYKLLVVFNLLCFTMLSSCQAMLNDGREYQGVARDLDGKIIANKDLFINTDLRFGGPYAPVACKEEHYVTSDHRGVYRLTIGRENETLLHKAVEWNGATPFLTIAIKGVEESTTEMLTIPYLMESEDKVFFKLWIDDLSNQLKSSIKYKLEK